MALTTKREIVPLSNIIPNEKNTRRHGETQIKELVRSLKKFGQIKPIVVDEKYRVLAGHGVFQAMKKAGFEKAEVNVVKGLKEKDKLKLLISDNRIFTLGVEDYIGIESIISELNDFDIPGFDEKLLKQILDSTSDEEDFGKKELKEEIKTKITKSVKCPKCGHKFQI